MDSSELTVSRPNEMVLELPGTTPAYMWVLTCDTPGCGCRTATVVVTDAGREAALKQGAA